MPIVKLFFQETMMRYNVCFLQGGTLIDAEKKFDGLRSRKQKVQRSK